MHLEYAVMGARQPAGAALVLWTVACCRLFAVGDACLLLVKRHAPYALQWTMSMPVRAWRIARRSRLTSTGYGCLMQAVVQVVCPNACFACAGDVTCRSALHASPVPCGHDPQSYTR